MLVSNNNQSHLLMLRFLSLTLNLSLRLKKIMLRLESLTQMISKKLLMLNGISFMINLIKLLLLELKSFCQIFLLETWLLNILLIKVFSVPVEFKKKIFKECLKLPEQFNKPLSMASLKMSWVFVENLKKSNLVTRDTICSLNARELNHQP